jgi:hypothetical protein
MTLLEERTSAIHLLRAGHSTEKVAKQLGVIRQYIVPQS